MREHQQLVRITGGLVVAAGVAFGLVRFYSGAPPGQNLEAAAAAIAFGSVIAAPGILAFLACATGLHSCCRRHCCWSR